MDNELENFRQAALKVIHMNWLLEQGNEVLAFSDEFKDCYKDLSASIPESFKTMLRLLVQCQHVGVQIMDGDEPLGNHRAIEVMEDWNGFQIDLAIAKEEETDAN